MRKSNEYFLKEFIKYENFEVFKDSMSRGVKVLLPILIEPYGLVVSD